MQRDGPTIDKEINDKRDNEKMARPEGFEPPTNRIGTCYSIQLSYGRAKEVFAERNVTDLGTLCKRDFHICRCWTGFTAGNTIKPI